VARETNSNFSNFLLVWDRLHRTARLNVPQDEIVVGVVDYRDARELGIVSLLLMPFRRQRQRTAADAPEPPPSRRADPAAERGRLVP
jgi:sterol desaturase/sphingolipid hydroxylase (fatty acid hydroxylase superfamily)